MRPSATAALLAALALAGCQNPGRPAPRAEESVSERPPDDVGPNRIDYVDSDGFDTVFESALVYQDPIVVVQTQHARPEWGHRLNAWIAAWNAGSRPPRPGRVARGQIPVGPVAVNGESVREFRFLVDDLLDRVETAVKGRSAWWAEERLKARRIALLQPYNLRFHLDPAGHIQLVFFHGRYAQHYRDIVKAVLPDVADEDGPGGWDRCVSCSRSKSAPVRLIPPAELTPP